jgi:PiT family inorganic phosphate transporter
VVISLLTVLVLAFVNGANDVSKGIATLAGSRRATYRQAPAWGTLWTAAGACAAVVISFGLINVFTSSLVAADVLAFSSFPLAVAAGAFIWVLLASVTGLPVSTTHALTGAIVGVALGAGGVESIRWGLLLSTIEPFARDVFFVI